MWESLGTALASSLSTSTSTLMCRKFDIGVYTVITSVDPLRVYVYQEEILLRWAWSDAHFCVHTYNTTTSAMLSVHCYKA